MSANLSPEYLKAEESYKAAKDPSEKLRYLEMMLTTIPKHKGTDKMQADIKRRIAKTKELLEKKSGGAKRYNPFKVEREGVGQIAIVGAPNSGKSALVGNLTNAKCTVADYPFTTTKPIPGMMAFENIQIQLVDLPPVSMEYTEPIMVGMIRNTDGAILVFDLTSDDPLSEIEIIKEILGKHKVEFSRNPAGKFTPDGVAHLKTLLVGTKLDVEGAQENLDLVKELYEKEFTVLGISTESGVGLDDIREKVFNMLNIIRVYTKSPGKEPDYSDPVSLKIGATVKDFASNIHKDFAKELKFAKIWSKSDSKFDGQKVNRDESLIDGDVIELHI